MSVIVAIVLYTWKYGFRSTRQTKQPQAESTSPVRVAGKGPRTKHTAAARSMSQLQLGLQRCRHDGDVTAQNGVLGKALGRWRGASDVDCRRAPPSFLYKPSMSPPIFPTTRPHTTHSTQT